MSASTFGTTSAKRSSVDSSSSTATSLTRGAAAAKQVRLDTNVVRAAAARSMPSGLASASNAVRQEMLSSKSSVSARVCHQREAVDEDVEEDNTELKEPARERAGERDPSEVMELERERETTGRSSSADALDALVRLEHTDSSSETAGAARVAMVKSLSRREPSCGHAEAEERLSAGNLCSEAMRRRLRRLPPLRVRLGNFIVGSAILQA